MPGFISRLVEWFQARSIVQKALIVIGALVILVIASPLAILIAVVVLLISLVVLGLRMVRRGSLRGPALVAVVSLVTVVLFSGISQTLYGGDQPQETTDIREAPKDPVADPEPESAQEQEPEPEEPDPTEHLVTAEEYHQLGAWDDPVTPSDDYVEEHILKGGLKDCIHAKYKDMYGEDTWGEVIQGDGWEVDSPYGMDAPEALMIEEGAGCTIQEGIDQLGNWTDWEWRQANKHFKDGL